MLDGPFVSFVSGVFVTCDRFRGPMIETRERGAKELRASEKFIVLLGNQTLERVVSALPLVMCGPSAIPQELQLMVR